MIRGRGREASSPTDPNLSLSSRNLLHSRLAFIALPRSCPVPSPCLCFLFPMPKSQTPTSLNPESLLRRIDTVIERSAARLQKEADAELESARNAGTTSHFARESEWIEKELHELNQFPDELTEYGCHRVRELRAYRLSLNLQLEQYKEHFNRRAQVLFQCLEQSRRAARRVRRGVRGAANCLTSRSSGWWKPRPGWKSS